MKAIVLLFDSLNRRYLSSYGCDWTITPNFRRLAERTVVFDNAFVGSMPCMPARRELHTGRYNFFHRSWGPVEPFDDSMPAILAKNGVYTHLVTDHHHYWEEGGCTYHTKYSSAELIRGREGDPWKGHVNDPELPKFHRSQRIDTNYKQEFHNREYLVAPEEQPQYQTVSSGIQFMETNRDADDWMLQIEIFDPHEPFYAPKKYYDMYPHEYGGDFFDWPQYKRCDESEEDVNHIKMEYAALVTMCDDNLGRILDKMDELNLWDDTMLIVSSDHGYSLGENGWWAKIFGGWHNATAHIPYFVWDPRFRKENVRNDCLVQWIDIAPTLLDYFHIPIPEDMQGKPLRDVIAKGDSVHEYIAFGVFGGHANITDGEYVYMRAPSNPENVPLYEYTVMPTHLAAPFSVEELRLAEFVRPFDFTKGCRVMKMPGVVQNMCTPEFWSQWKNELYNIKEDYAQRYPLDDWKEEARMLKALETVMLTNDAPVEQYVRLGMEIPKTVRDDRSKV